MNDDTTALLNQIEAAIAQAEQTAQEMEELYTQLTEGNED